MLLKIGFQQSYQAQIQILHYPGTVKAMLSAISFAVEKQNAAFAKAKELGYNG
jgi:hypothetical protein